MKKLFGKNIAVGLMCALLIMLVSLPPASAWKNDDGEDGKFGPWSAPVNLGPPVNTVLADYQPFISKDGLSLYFSVLEGPTPNSPQDIWVAKRNSRRSEEHTSELQSRLHLVCRLLLEKKK